MAAAPMIALQPAARRRRSPRRPNDAAVRRAAMNGSVVFSVPAPSTSPSEARAAAATKGGTAGLRLRARYGSDQKREISAPTTRCGRSWTTNISTIDATANAITKISSQRALIRPINACTAARYPRRRRRASSPQTTRRSSLRTMRDPAADRCSGASVARPFHPSPTYPEPRGSNDVRSSAEGARRRADGRASCRRLRDGDRPSLRRRRHRRRRAARRVARGLERRARRRDGTLGLRQVDAHAHPGRSRPADGRRGPDRRPREHLDVRQRADEAPPRAHRLRLPVLQPAADVDGGGERDPPPAHRRTQDRTGLARDGARLRRSRRAPDPPPVGALRWSAAARRGCARAAVAADGAVRRRADRKPGLADVGGDPRAAPARRRRLRPDDDHGHARPEGGGDRRPRPPLRGRSHRPGGHEPMTAVALKGLAGRKLRAVLTALAIVLGVAMVSGSFVLTDSIQKAFHSLFASSYANTDAVVSGQKLVDYSNSGNATLPASLLSRVRSLPDVEAATGLLTDMSGGVLVAKLYDKHGKIINGNGNPTFGVGIAPNATRFNPMRL